MITPHNHHGTLISIDGKGVLICGPSGNGKTSLALHLYRRALAAKLEVQIIADDQVLLSSSGAQLLGRCPPSIQGKIEVRGFGVVEQQPLNSISVPISWHVALVDQPKAVRFYEGATVELATIAVPSLSLAAQNIEGAANAIFAALRLPLSV